jgi:hypothetical protein
MMKTFLLTILLMLCSGCAMTDKYAEGQVWSYKTRDGEQGSTLQINRIEHDPKLGDIFHISVDGVRLDNPHAPGGITARLPHFPVSQQTLDKSCIESTGTAPVNPDYLEGYRAWREAFDAGQAGVFDIPVAEIVDIVESSISQRTTH